MFSVELKLKSPPPNLTDLAKRNNGEFPSEWVYEVIQATLIAANNTREMPTMGFDPVIRSRVPAIVDYLDRMQEK